MYMKVEVIQNQLFFLIKFLKFETSAAVFSLTLFLCVLKSHNIISHDPHFVFEVLYNKFLTLKEMFPIEKWFSHE